ncbi:TetR/AcrR family transcriptional regulator [Nocardiopsis lambiniae]|uniref:TetR family transcriptional regulator n=1 Tax=Nocardiopsis lambiniae TaxID=3075539 RepID=A0ABU2MC47_9ACTN|nr:TetR family transcriptional regulator [Nocardiopsis sp. DSM 44743]MDT0330257.1 TetR family transcriptional regulator [Nocardiopsis sp. DSM 44743]
MEREQRRPTPPPRARRDPHGRRHAIVEAAADLIVHQGAADLTHRRIASRARVPLGSTTYYFSSLTELKVAALEHLTTECDAWLQRARTALADHDGDPIGLCALLADYLADRDRVHTDFALTSAAAGDPALRPLSLIWFDGLVELLSEYTDPHTAHAITVFTDGAVVHALLHDTPLDTTTLHRTITALMRAAAERTP